MSRLLSEQAIAAIDDLVPLTLSNVPRGAISRVLTELNAIGQDTSGGKSKAKGVVFIASDGQQLGEIRDSLEFYSSDLEVLEFPAWDCLPYDRVSPSSAVIAERLYALSRLASTKDEKAANPQKPVLLLTSANAIVQRLTSPAEINAQVVDLAPGMARKMDDVVNWLASNGFERAPSVRERGEFAVRGGIVDYFAPGDDEPKRLDFFGDTLESIRGFDLATQRSSNQIKSSALVPMSEVQLDPSSIANFRTAYLERFGAATREDALYQAISEGRRFAGMEHWLPLFTKELTSLFSYLEDFTVVSDGESSTAINERLEQVEDHYQSRIDAMQMDAGEGTPYKPIEPSELYFSSEQLSAELVKANCISLSGYELPESDKRRVISLGGRQVRSFDAERQSGQNIFEAVGSFAADERKEGKTLIICAWSEGSRDRLTQVLSEHGLGKLVPISHFGAIENLKAGETGLAIFPLEKGFGVGSLTFLSEQDILGDRLVRKARSGKKAADFISEVASLSEGDVVVHVDHGIGRFTNLRTIEAAGAPHDCLEIIYAGDDKLFLPVENIELLSRYGSSETEVMLDKLGGVAWQARKAKLKKRILEMADQLIAIAAKRALRTCERMLPPAGVYDEFCARFPYEETEDQLTSIEAVLDDLAAGTPMDRLVCGDVGFGKTEVALRAAFVAAMSGVQVAVVVPTTLLARQHFKSFSERFKGLPVKVQHASRLVGAKALADTKKGIASGDVDIVVGTHALLSQSIAFKRLGLLIIDEEQRFGVKHKERLKELKSDVHVLTLSATPIPRTMQLALTGVRELSLITTAPVDRMAVRTFVSPFDPLIIREALLRERHRGGQSFYVCPRVSDLQERYEFLREHVPELKVGIAHGQMPPGELEAVMNAFYDGQYDVLLSTTIVESGLDIPTANTLIVHRADMFGLAQLYQIRGRVGRSKTRAYAIFTVPVNRKLNKQAERRLKVLQSLDSIGAGFELASHDLDIRGSGNLLGEEQSGQIREVGYELYQQMLEEAVSALKDGGDLETDTKWSPQIAIGAPVLIPESYVVDLQLRLTLYRRLAELKGLEEIDAFGAEMIDRFGALPDEVDMLLKTVFVKGLCLDANIEKLDAGPKGLVISFRNNDFNNPAKLVEWIAGQGSLAKIRPDQSIVLQRDMPDAVSRLKSAAVVVSKLAKFAAQKTG